jgi:hypothetical protein
MMTPDNFGPLEEGESIRDLATKTGTYRMVRTTVGDYLALLGLFDPATRTGAWDVSVVNVAFQRATIDIKKNAIKRRMLRDLLRGGTVPPTVLAVRTGNTDDALAPRPEARNLIIDGLQRTHVVTVGAVSLRSIAQGDAIEDFVRKEIAEMEQLGQRPLSLDEFLRRPFNFQLWRDLEPEELVRLFILLNAGQQKVSPRQLLEVMGAHIRAMFESWGLPLLTERQERENPRRRTRRAVEEGRPIAGISHFRYDLLLDGLCAYLARNPHIKTSMLLQDAGDVVKLSVEDKSVEERITEIGSEVCKADFVWACKEFNQTIKRKYASEPRWVYAIQNNDNFFIPLMAALGDARNVEQARPALEDRKAKLVEIVSNGADDPLALIADNDDHLYGIQARINSNIGRRQRAVVYGAFRRYFRQGTTDSSNPIDWRLASLD